MECFVALAEELHFHRAADRCHISQPAMSQQISKLEQELGAQLAIRTKRSVSLTRAGEVFLIEARKNLAQLERSVVLTQRTSRGEFGHLTVGVTQPALYVAFPEIAREFSAQMPNVGLVVEEMTTSEQERALRDGIIDVGVLHPPLDDRTLAHEVIAEPSFSVVLPENHWLAKEPSIDLSDLAGEDFILFPRDIGPQLYDSIIAMCQSAGFSPRVVKEAHPAQSIIAFSAAGVGVGFIAAKVQRLDRPGAVYVPLGGKHPQLSVGIAMLPQNRGGSLIEAFIAAARSVGGLIS